MRTSIFTSLLALPVALALVACNGSDDTGDESASSTSTSTTTTTTTGETTEMTTSTTDTTTTTTTTTTTSTTTMDTTTGVDDPYVFDNTDPTKLSQVDRMGMPAINTAVITSKDKYNEASPADDAMGTFVDEITANVTGLHAALDDDLLGAGLVACIPADCVGQAAPLVVPDELTLTLDAPAGFPNGRKLADPVIDVTLAVVLLDLTVPGQTATTLAELPLNPPKNDKDFLGDFPYVADPH
ncbi:MAG: DUF4331 family protein [Nannocystaceae bacterium]